MAFIFTFMGLIVGIIVGVCLTLWYTKTETEVLEEEISNLLKLNEEQRESTSEYINKLVTKNKELETQIYGSRH